MGLIHFHHAVMATMLALSADDRRLECRSGQTKDYASPLSTQHKGKRQRLIEILLKVALNNIRPPFV
jgi:hypothetical protein